MKSFEEKCTAWADGTLSDEECAAFETELKFRPEERQHREDAAALGQLLRSHQPEVTLKNPEFFNQRILEEIEAHRAMDAPAPVVARKMEGVFPVWRLVWGGVFSLILSLGLFKYAVPQGLYTSNGRDAYLAEVIEAKTGSASIYASSFHAKKNNVTVLWLDGLPYIPDAFAAK